MKEIRKFIGVCGARLFEQNAMNFLKKLTGEANKRGYFPVVFSANSDSEEDCDEILGEKDLFELCKCVGLCCLIILSETLRHKGRIQQIAEMGKNMGIPVFTLGGGIDGCYNLEMNYKKGFESIVRHVVEDHGVRNINMLAGFQDNPLSEERIAIYRKVLEENGIAFEGERVGYGDFWERPTKKAVRGFLKNGLAKPEAIVCANDSMAIAACDVLKGEGYMVPNDILVTGFDGIQNGKYHTPMIATAEPDYRSSLDFIFREMQKVEETGKAEPHDCQVDFVMVPSQSCGCKPKHFFDRNKMISTLFAEVGDCAWHSLAMNQMVTSVLDKRTVMDIAHILPDIVTPWSNQSHFACLKAQLLEGGEVPEQYGEMVTILEGNKKEFQEPGERFWMAEFLPHIDKVLDREEDIHVFIVSLLHSGSVVYGYLVEGFRKLDERKGQRCNEFAMFLSHSINTVLHNGKLNELNQNLTDAYNEISSLYIRDAMTDTYNRRGFGQKMGELLRRKESMGMYLYIISIDMDGLKYINDHFGHAEGDFAIITMAKAMQQTGGRDAICARFGGDEFVCAILWDEEDPDGGKVWAKRLNQTIQELPGVKEKPYSITASVGLACCKVTEEMDAEAMILSADKKMYQDKVARKKQR